MAFAPRHNQRIPRIPHLHNPIRKRASLIFLPQCGKGPRCTGAPRSRRTPSTSDGHVFSLPAFLPPPFAL
ncbi:hypothetical protein HMPREF0262_02033 [Clostridium sp. ATCC 29733]|nr:hypothetical protein HMPREF0262_02033 [Clostridium sp. ATCC 29733]